MTCRASCKIAVCEQHSRKEFIIRLGTLNPIDHETYLPLLQDNYHSNSSLNGGYEIIVPEGIVISGIVDVAVTDSILIALGNTDSGLVSVFDLS